MPVGTLDGRIHPEIRYFATDGGLVKEGCGRSCCCCSPTSSSSVSSFPGLPLILDAAVRCSTISPQQGRVPRMRTPTRRCGGGGDGQVFAGVAMVLRNDSD